MLSQAVLIAGVIGLIGVNIIGGVMCSHCVLHSPPTYFASLSIFFFFQTEIAKRLNAILAQIMPFLSQEVGFECGLQIMSQLFFLSDILLPVL